MILTRQIIGGLCGFETLLRAAIPLNKLLQAKSTFPNAVTNP